MKTITKEWLREQRACAEGYDWFIHQRARDAVKILQALIKESKYDWANWLIVRRIDRKQYIQYAVFAAKQVEYLWKDSYPKEYKIWRDWIDNGCKAADAAYVADAARAANAAVCAANAAYAANAARAAYAAALAAYAAVCAANAAYTANAARAAGVANAAYVADAARAAYVADTAYVADDAEIQKRILEYGITLLNESEER
ncbi:hypothetical protein M0R72_13285 [Candidatus Pacearchaeota archaeon]|jgi:hypothetical protein|nr:hypothetical protein [Candidatus Pacearchaeota archaeon]